MPPPTFPFGGKLPGGLFKAVPSATRQDFAVDALVSPLYKYVREAPKWVEDRNVAILTCKALRVEFRCGVVILGDRVFMENWYVLYLLFMYVLSISFILVCVDTNLCRTHSNALERANDRQNDQHQQNPG